MTEDHTQTQDYTQAEGKGALPRGMGNLAAFITTGKSYFGYDLGRDGLPEVVVRAYARTGSEGLVAIVRLAHTITPFPVLADAAALTEWGIEHYAGQAVVSEADREWAQSPIGHVLGFGSEGVWQPEWIARGRLMRAHVEDTWGAKIATIEDAPDNWADWIDWPRVAEKEAENGKVTFVQHELKVYGEPTKYEVDMFVGTWEGGVRP